MAQRIPRKLTDLIDDRNPADLAAEGQVRRVRGYAVAGLPDAATQAAIDALLAKGWPDWSIEWQVLGESALEVGELSPDSSLVDSLLTSPSLIGIFAPDSGEISSTSTQGVLIGILAADSSVIGSAASQGALSAADALTAADSLIASTLENGALIGIVSADNSVATLIATEGALSLAGVLSADAAIIASALDQGTLVGILAAGSSMVAASADAGALVGVLVPASSTVGVTAENGALTGTLAADSSVITSTLSAGGLEALASAPTQPVISATGGDTTVTITKTSGGTGATSYDLKWGTSAGSRTNTISGVTLPYTHTGRTNGTTYYYSLVAVNGSGSTESAEVSAAAYLPQAYTYTFDAGAEGWTVATINADTVGTGTWQSNGGVGNTGCLYGQGSGYEDTVEGSVGFNKVPPTAVPALSIGDTFTFDLKTAGLIGLNVTIYTGAKVYSSVSSGLSCSYTQTGNFVSVTVTVTGAGVNNADPRKVSITAVGSSADGALVNAWLDNVTVPAGWS